MPLIDFFDKESGEWKDRVRMTVTEARLRAKRLKYSFEQVKEACGGAPDQARPEASA